MEKQIKTFDEFRLNEKSDHIWTCNVLVWPDKNSAELFRKDTQDMNIRIDGNPKEKSGRTGFSFQFQPQSINALSELFNFLTDSASQYGIDENYIKIEIL